MGARNDKQNEYIISDESNTLPDITRIMESYYDLGRVDSVRKLSVGDSNFNYYLTLERDGEKINYFGQLYSTSKTLEELEYELALREYYSRNSSSDMKCAQALPCRNGMHMVACRCAGTGYVRYFCVFDFLEGKALVRESWSCGKITPEIIKGCAKAMALYHMGTVGYVPPASVADVKGTYEQELAEYRRAFTDEFDRRRKGSSYEYYTYFGKCQPRLLELLDRQTDLFRRIKSDLPFCIFHIDTSPQNYMFDENVQPVGIVDLDNSCYRPRILDLCWFINEGLCRYDEKNRNNEIRTEDILLLLRSYDDAIVRAGGGAPGKLTDTEKEHIMEIYELVSIHMGFYYIWDYIMHDNPSNTFAFNKYWGEWTMTALEYVEKNMQHIRDEICKS